MKPHYIVIDWLSQGDGDVIENLFCSLFDRICPGFRQILGKKSSGSRPDIILPSYKDLPAAAASSDCCHFGVIICVMHLQIFTFKTEKWTRNRTSTSYEFFLAIVIISLIPSYPTSALVGTWTRDLSLTKGVLYRWATRAILNGPGWIWTNVGRASGFTVRPL